MNNKMRRKFEKVNRWMPVVVYICASVGIIWANRVYAHGSIEFATYFASVVSIIITLFIFELLFIWDRLYKLERRLYKLEREKNGA